MVEELKKIREDLMYANDNDDKILIGFAINRLDSLIYKQCEVKKLPLTSIRNRYFAVAYRASSHKGMLDGHINITVEGTFLERARVVEIVKENHCGTEDVIITNIFEMNKEEYECWVGNDS